MSVKQKIIDFYDRKPRLFQFLLTLAVILVGLLIFIIFMATRSEVKRSKMTLPPPLVTTITARLNPQQLVIEGEGTVTPLREINLIPQVSGKVIYISPALADGGAFRKGETLLRIDPIDYELAVKSAEARVADLESRLLLTIEEAEVAKEEWKLRGEGTDDESPPPLVAKEPQLEAARASLAAASADLDKANLNLARATLKAPFDGRINRKSVDIGQFVSVGQQLGSMFSTEAAEIAVPLTQEELEWLDVPGLTSENRAGSEALIRAEIAGEEVTWTGKIMRSEGMLDMRTRMINVTVQVERPYEKRPPLIMGLFVSVDLLGKTIPGAVWLPRSAVRENDIVWVIDEDSRIRFRKVDVERFGGSRFLITSGIEEGELVVVSSLKIVTDGIRVNHRPLEEPER